MLDRLIAFLRASLAGSRAGAQTLADEFDRLRDYLALMEVRMGERLATRIALPADAAAAPVPPLLLQPLVENSIKHGLEPQREGGRIEVERRARRRRRSWSASATRGVGAAAALRAAASGGFGLGQVRERLHDAVRRRAASFALVPVDDAEGGTLRDDPPAVPVEPARRRRDTDTLSADR